MARPSRDPHPGERVGLSLRVTPAVKVALDHAAERAGRSLSQEAEFRLEASFGFGDRLDRIEAKLDRLLGEG
jgi:hypothetical protein